MPGIRILGMIDLILGSLVTLLFNAAGIARTCLDFWNLGEKLVSLGCIAMLGRPRRTSALSDVCSELANMQALVTKVIVSMTESVASVRCSPRVMRPCREVCSTS